MTNELAKYGYEYTVKKAFIIYGMIVLMAAIFGLLYKLELKYIAAIGVIGVLISPMVIIQIMKGRYHTTLLRFPSAPLAASGFSVNLLLTYSCTKR